MKNVVFASLVLAGLAVSCQKRQFNPSKTNSANSPSARSADRTQNLRSRQGKAFKVDYTITTERWPPSGSGNIFHITKLNVEATEGVRVYDKVRMVLVNKIHMRDPCKKVSRDYESLYEMDFLASAGDTSLKADLLKNGRVKQVTQGGGDEMKNVSESTMPIVEFSSGCEKQFSNRMEVAFVINGEWQTDPITNSSNFGLNLDNYKEIQNQRAPLPEGATSDYNSEEYVRIGGLFIGAPSKGASVSNDLLSVPGAAGAQPKNLQFTDVSSEKLEFVDALKACKAKGLRLPTMRELFDFCTAGFEKDRQGYYSQTRCPHDLWSSSVADYGLNGTAVFFSKLSNGIPGTAGFTDFSISYRCVSP